MARGPARAGGRREPDPPVRHVTAGRGALKALALILGLEGGEGWRLDGLCCQGDEVRLSLRHGGHRVAFFLLPPGAADAVARGRKVSLAPEGAVGPAATRLLEAAAARLGGLGLGDVVKMIESDPESFAQACRPGEHGDSLKVPYVGAPFGLQDAGWRNFYGDQDFDVLLAVPDCTTNNTVTIQYADLECYYSRPDQSFRKWSFLDWPEDHTESLKRERSSFVCAELSERDMIMGTGPRADALVAKVRELAAAGNYLVVTHLCTPIVLGEDFNGLARRCEKISGCNAVGWSQKDRDNRDNFGEFFRSLFARPGFFDGKSDPAAVNLFHFPERCRREELAPILAELGLEVNACVFPDMDFPSAERIPLARWQVFCERTCYPVKLRELMESRPRPVVPVPAPFGLAGTRECLGRIAAAAGKEREFKRVWARRMAALAGPWEAMRKEAAGRRLAFVVSEATLPGLMGLRFGLGAPILKLVGEMGFGIDLLYFEAHGEPPALPAGCPPAEVGVFRSPWELERCLAEGRFDAVYSDVFFDWRVSRAGKARFSSRDFDMGLGGAARAFERLLAAARNPFYRRYGEHLARVPRKVHV